MLIIGVTGGMGSGKSTVAKALRRRGAVVLDADKLARRALSGADVRRKVINLFGKTIIRGAGVDRKKIADAAFSDKNKLRRLNAIVHPVVIGEITKELRALEAESADAVVVIDAPLLIEANLHKMADELIVVKAALGQQITRSIDRLGITKEDAKRRIAAQMPFREKIKLADNSGALGDTLREVEAIWKKITRG